MEMKIRKRDGSVATFDESKIAKAVKGAFSDLGRTVSDADLDFVVRRSVASLTPDKDGTVGVEDVQDKVEMALIDSGFKEVALQYARYREKHAQMRDGLDYGKLVDDYINASDWRVKENATIAFGLGGMILSNSGAVSANYWLNHVYDKEIADAHRNADMHIHDLGMISGYCAGWNLKQLLLLGFGGVENKVSSAPAKHLRVVCHQILSLLSTLANEWAGAMAFSSFDTYLAPFIKADRMTYDEVKQCMQELVFGLNVSTRFGGQPVFSNVTIDWRCPNDLKNLPAIVGGKEMDFTYGDCQKEMDMINKAFIEVMIAGDANGRGFEYPIPTYSITKDFDWSETENNKLLFEMAAKYGIPYFSNYINSDMNPSDVRSMCPLTYETSIIVKNEKGEREDIEIGKAFEKAQKGIGTADFWDGEKWVSGRFVRTPATDVIEVKTKNGAIVDMGCFHLQPTLEKGTLKAEELSVGDSLPFSEGGKTVYSKIASLGRKKNEGKGFLYCVELSDDKHLFVLSNGLMTHNCRLRLDLRELRRRNGGFFGSAESTGSVGVVTLNMPRLAYLSKDKEEFYARLDKLMALAARSLEMKRAKLNDLYERGMYPYTRRYLGSVAFKNHFSTIGLVGMNECCLNAKWLKDDLTHKDAQDFTVDVLNHMRNKLADFQEEYPETLFNLEATPAESTCVSGDTSVWTDKGLKTVNEIMADKNLSILSYNESTNAPEFKKLADCWRTKEDAEVMKITFSNGDSVKVTPNHKMAKRFMTGRGANRKCWIEYVEAGTLKVGDRLFACHVFTKDSKSLGETYQEVECRLGKLGGNFPMHRLLAENYFGKIPEGFVVHHKDFDKKNNSKENLEVISDAEHRRIHENDEGRNFFRDVNGAGNPFYGKHHTDETKEKISETKKETKRSWYPNFRASMANKDTRKKMSDGNKGKAFEQFSRYMPECSTDSIVEKWKENKTIGQIARELGKPYTYSLVKSRLKHVGLLPNHQIAKIEFLSEREDVYDLEVEGNHNFFISGGADDAVLVHNCYRLAKHDKERYPDIITAGKAGETPYYTNSSHLPVGYTEDIFSALDVEDRFQTLYTSGTVFHAFLGQRLPNWQSCMKLVRRIAENYKLPYFTMSPTYSVCPNHGYIAGEVYKCPVCGAETEVYSRITGYYRPLKNWNAGKTQEFHDRRTYRPSDPSVSPTDPSKSGQTDDWATRTDSSMTGRTDKTLTSTDGKTVECSCSALDRTETDAKPEADNEKVDNEKVDAEAKSQASGRPMLFYSKTCPNCKMAHMLLDKAGIKYDDYDAYENQELAKKLCVSSAPTLLVPKGDGNFSVYANVSEIKGWIEGKNEW